MAKRSWTYLKMLWVVPCIGLTAVTVICPRPLATAVITVDEDCSLVEAIETANGDPAGGCEPGDAGRDRIELTGDVTLTEIDNEIDGPNGTPSITSTIDIDGHGHTIRRGAEFFRLLHVAAEGDLTLTDVTISDGSLLSGEYTGGGVRNLGVVTLRNTTLSQNKNGALVNAGGRAALINSEVGTYRTSMVLNTGSLVIVNSTLKESSSGGLVNHGYAVLADSTVHRNYYYFGGGGILNTGRLLVVGTTVSDNETYFGGSPGGGLLNRFPGVATIVNSTFSGNDTDNWNEGGAIYNSGTATIRNTTFSGNEASYGSAVYTTPLGLTTISGSIFGENFPSRNCVGDVVDGGKNLDDDGSCPGPSLLGLSVARENNGGPTDTHRLLPGSTAIDVGPCQFRTDQRGFLRHDGLCDSGSYESGGQFVPRPTLTATGSCPGPVELRLADATPDALVSIGAASHLGFQVVDTGTCRGAWLQLNRPRFIATLAASADGTRTETLDVGEAQCHGYLQALDLATCRPSRATRLEGTRELRTRRWQHRRSTYQRSVPGAPLNGPTMSLVRQPP